MRRSPQRNECAQPRLLQENRPWSTVPAREQELRTGLVGLGARHEEPEGSGEPIDRVEDEANRERVLDLLARDAGSQHRAHILCIQRLSIRLQFPIGEH
jgi:hypothetical protein